MELEGQLKSLKLSLEAIRSEAETKTSQAAELESSKSALETTLQETQEALTKLEAEYEELKSALRTSKEEVRIYSNG